MGSPDDPRLPDTGAHRGVPSPLDLRRAEAWRRAARLSRRHSEVCGLLGTAISEALEGTGGCAPDVRMRAIQTMTVPDLVTTARALGCRASELVAVLGVAHYERTRPDPGYRHRQVAPPPSLPPDLRGAITSDAVRLRFGYAARSYRRANVSRPIHLIARDAGMTYSLVTKIETGKSASKVLRVVNLADALEVELSTLLRMADL